MSTVELTAAGQVNDRLLFASQLRSVFEGFATVYPEMPRGAPATPSIILDGGGDVATYTAVDQWNRDYRVLCIAGEWDDTTRAQALETMVAVVAESDAYDEWIAVTPADIHEIGDGAYLSQEIEVTRYVPQFARAVPPALTLSPVSAQLTVGTSLWDPRTLTGIVGWHSADVAESLRGVIGMTSDTAAESTLFGTTLVTDSATTPVEAATTDGPVGVTPLAWTLVNGLTLALLTNCDTGLDVEGSATGDVGVVDSSGFSCHARDNAGTLELHMGLSGVVGTAPMPPGATRLRYHYWPGEIRIFTDADNYAAPVLKYNPPNSSQDIFARSGRAHVTVGPITVRTPHPTLAGIPLEAAPVAVMPDLTGQHRHLICLDDGQDGRDDHRPTYRTNATNTGTATLDFTPTDTHLTATAAVYGTRTQPYTHAAAFAVDTTTGNNEYVVDGVEGTGQRGALRYISSNGFMAMHAGVNRVNGHTTASTDTDYVLIGRFDSPTNSVLNWNDSYPGTRGDAGSLDSPGLKLGEASGGTMDLAERITEVVVCDAYLTDQETIDLNGHLSRHRS